MKTVLISFMVLVLMTAPASAVVIEDNFDAYSDGGLTGQGGWIDWGPGWASLDIGDFTGLGKVANSTDLVANNIGNYLPFTSASSGTVELQGVSMQLNHPDSMVDSGLRNSNDSPIALSIINDRNAQFGSDVRWLITTAGGDAQYNEKLGTEVELLGVWMDTTITVDLDRNTGTITIEAPDLTTTTSAGWDGSLKTQVRNIDPSAVVDRVHLGTFLAANGNRIDMVGEGAPIPSTPARFEWKTDEVGLWTASTNWSPGAPAAPPDSPGETAVFGTMISTPTTVVTNVPITVNRVEFNNATHSYSVAGLGNVNLAASTAPTPVNPTVDVLGTHQFQAIVNLHNDTIVDVSSDSTLSFNNTLNLMSNTLTKTGVGTLAIRNDLVTDGGTVSLQQGTISGNGTIGGDVDNGGGTISPGNNSASLDVVPEPSACVLLISMLVVALGRFGRHGR